MEELIIGREKLSEILEQLDALARDVPKSLEYKEGLEEQQNINRNLTKRNIAIEEELKSEKIRYNDMAAKCEKLEKQNIDLEERIEKLCIENQSLSSLAQKRDEDNETISNVLEKISCDYESLQKAFDGQRGPKDDKIQALRNTAKALEAENQLLQEEKAIKAQDNANIHNSLLNKLTKFENMCKSQKEDIGHLEKENEQLKRRSTEMEDEKLNVLRELSKMERCLETKDDLVDNLKRERGEILERKMNTEEMLAALKDSKRVVELKYQNILVEKGNFESKLLCLNQSNELMQVKNQSLEERVRSLEHEKEDQTEICAEIQQNLIQKTSEYEAKIRSMQLELDSRIDELDVTKKVDVEKVKNHYFELFHEKAAELNSVRTDLESCESSLKSYKTKCSDLEYREQELSDLVDRIRSDSRCSKEDLEIRERLEDYLAKNSRLQEQIDVIKRNFQEMRGREKEIIAEFSSRSDEMSALLSEKEIQIEKLTSANVAIMDESNTSVDVLTPNNCESELQPISETVEDKQCLMVNGGTSQSLKKKKRRKKSKV